MKKFEDRTYLRGYRRALRALLLVGCILHPIVGLSDSSSDKDGTTSGATMAPTAASVTTAPWSLRRFTRNMGLSFFNASAVSMEQVHSAAARLEMYNYLSVEYGLGPGRKISARPVFLMGLAGTDYRDEYRSADWRIGDAYINYLDRMITVLPGDFELGGNFRVYLPTSEDTQKRGTIARFRPWLTATKDLARRWEFTIHLEPDYYFQGQTGALDDKGKVRGNANFGYEGRMELKYQLSRWLSASGSVGHNQMWFHTVPSEAAFDPYLNEPYRTEGLVTQGALYISTGPTFLIAGVKQRRDLVSPRRSFTLFHDAETEYFILNTWRIL